MGIFFKKKPRPFNEEIFNKVKKTISTQLSMDESKITPEFRLKNDDELDFVFITELIMELEEAFTIETQDEEVEKLETVKDLVNYLDDLIRRKEV